MTAAFDDNIEQMIRKSQLSSVFLVRDHNHGLNLKPIETLDRTRLVIKSQITLIKFIVYVISKQYAL